MPGYQVRLKRKALKKSVHPRDALNTYMQPFKEMPSVNHIDEGGPDQISAHDLFSHYTADIIKKDTIFNR